LLYTAAERWIGSKTRARGRSCVFVNIILLYGHVHIIYQLYTICMYRNKNGWTTIITSSASKTTGKGEPVIYGPWKLLQHWRLTLFDSRAPNAVGPWTNRKMDRGWKRGKWTYEKTSYSSFGSFHSASSTMFQFVEIRKFSFNKNKIITI